MAHDRHLQGRPVSVPTGWPTIQRPSRHRLRWWRAAIVVGAVYGMAIVVLYVLDSVERQWWQWLTVIVATAVFGAGLALLWRLAPRPRRIGQVPGPRSTKDAVMVLRRALLRGDPVGADRFREVAALVAGGTRSPVTAAFFVVVLGNNLLNAVQNPSEVGFWLTSAGLACWLVSLTLIDTRRSVRINRVAAALGAMPVVVDE